MLMAALYDGKDKMKTDAFSGNGDEDEFADTKKI